MRQNTAMSGNGLRKQKLQLDRLVYEHTEERWALRSRKANRQVRENGVERGDILPIGTTI